MPDEIQSLTVDRLKIRVFADIESLARQAAADVQAYLGGVLADRGTAAVILATGNSQIRFLDELDRLGGVEWSRIELFHMDEYLGIAADHSASFRRYLRERVEERLRPKAFHYLEGDSSEPMDECDRYGSLLASQPIDLCCLGIGENGHLAFNDPPVADFVDPRPVKIVKLDEACRMQQVREGHFPGMDVVPQYALTLTIPTLLSARRVVCLAPESRKAVAVRNAIRGSVDPSCPASILRHQSHAELYLDRDSAALLNG